LNTALEPVLTTLYGIKNCDTVKKAQKWLDDNAIDYRFHDFRLDGLAREQLMEWVEALGWETLVNKRSTTWKQLDQGTRDAMDKGLAIDTMLANPTLIKRPVLDTGNKPHVGFKEAEYDRLFANRTA
jgi:Spx/MgsR family transcriptional regulator